MEESDLQVHFRRNTNSKELFIYVDQAMSLEKFKNLLKSYLEDGNTREALRIYTRAYSSDFLKTECLEVLVDGVAEIARKSITESQKFSLDSFICGKCNDVIKDPVTFKCGHTFSKSCALSEVRNDSFACPKCNKTYSFAYLSQLKNNVTILSLVEKLYDRYLLKYKSNLAATSENTLDRMYGADMYLISSSERRNLLSEVEPTSFIYHPTTSSGYYKTGNLLFNFGDFEEAFKAYMTSYTLDSSAVYAKKTAIEVLHQLLQGYPCSLSHSAKSLSLESSKHLKRKPLKHSESSLRSSGSSDSLHVAEDDRSSSDEEETKIDLNSERKDLHLLLDGVFDCIKNIAGKESILSTVETSCIDKREFECPLCMRILWEPVTTTCGHTFCRVCLNRCFDHQPTCPLCKASLASFLAERVQNTTEFLELAIRNLLPSAYAERQAIYLEEMEELTNAGKDPEHEIPLFICIVALPTVPCPLHVFEPRYRLMIRQCMESGSRQFGMCGVVDDEIAEYGTMLEIRDVQYFPDGRSIVDTVGRKRFRILRRGERDGYHTGAVEFLEDQPLNDADLQCIEEKHDRTYKISKVWFMHLPTDTRRQILQHFGPMPRVENNYISSPDGPSWLWWMLAILPIETRLKVLLISLTSLTRRLEFLYRILLHFQSAIMS